MAMELFMAILFGDSSLPITMERLESVLFTKKKNKNYPPMDYETRAGLPLGIVRVHRAVLGTDTLNMQLHAGTIFPFTSQGIDKRTGAFGKVIQVKIHPSHCQDPLMTVGSTVLDNDSSMHYIK
ncbi:uncharacterized protein RAG0_08641 [Rhynchosporium agropyri]|uniref:Uncharacterized protein n=1 Tax=Rhynchosporium agropyri TaxID=914238 RepID=A0A1E1KRS2_9HELO|nr:uncharacterized protein RAG0_08641 [Rhynchosporium agropyri]